MGKHLCVLFDTEDEQLAIASAFIGDGLRHGVAAKRSAQPKAVAWKIAGLQRLS